MSKWMRFMLDSGRVDGSALLKPATFAELLTPQTMVPPGQFYPSARLTRPHWMTYALGWFQQDYDGRAVSFHTGSIDGMVAIIGLIPDERLGVYVLANPDHVELRHALMLKVFDLWGPAKSKPRDWSTELRTLYGNQRAQAVAATKAAEAKRVTGTKPSLPLRTVCRYVRRLTLRRGDGDGRGERDPATSHRDAGGRARALAVRDVPCSVGAALARYRSRHVRARR